VIGQPLLGAQSSTEVDIAPQSVAKLIRLVMLMPLVYVELRMLAAAKLFQ
jgi:hypothetical protein